MENALYYTLSTIAQTLAGALAVMVAVVVFRLQGVEELIEAGDALLHTWEGEEGMAPHAETWPLLIEKGPPALRERVRSPHDPLATPDIWQRCAGAYKAWHFRRKVTTVLYLALGATVVDAALCFGALPLTPTIASSSSLTGAVLGSAVGLGVVTLGLDVWLIARTVGRPRGGERAWQPRHARASHGNVLLSCPRDGPADLARGSGPRGGLGPRGLGRRAVHRRGDPAGGPLGAEPLLRRGRGVGLRA